MGAALALMSVTLVAGPLDPPQAPAPTASVVEPRIPISSAAFGITQPGSYYLTQNLVGSSGQVGISVSASDVTIDLNGFSLIGVPGSTNGINTGSDSNLVVRTGTVRDWDGHGIDCTLSDGVVLEDVAFIGNGADGAVGNEHVTARRCRFEGNGSRGLGLGVGSESLVEECTASQNNSHGLEIEGRSTIRDCISTDNGGINIRAADTGQIVGCTTSLGGAGIAVQDNCTVMECEISSPNGGNGLSFGDDCVIARNRIDDVSIEIFATPGALRTNSEGSVIEDNIVTNSIIGLFIEGTGNIIRRNTVHGNWGNYLIDPENQVDLLLSEIPQTINFPANILVTGDLVASGEGGIGICHPDVTVDLGGHTLDGTGGTGSGIHIQTDSFSGPIENTVIRNGVVRNWLDGGITMLGATGTHIENVAVQENGAEGISAGNMARVVACTARLNQGVGILTEVGAVVVDCIAEGNQEDGIAVGDNSTVERCVGRFNVESGILGSDGVTVRGCVGESNRFDNLLVPLSEPLPQGSPNNGHGIRVGDGGTIVDCATRLNDVMGIRTGSGGSVINCSSRENDQNGFQVTGTLVGCSAAENLGDGFRFSSGSSATNCVAERNEGNGFSAVSGGIQITDCSAYFNEGDGFALGSSSQIQGSRASISREHGISASSDCRIVGNQCDANGNGVGDGSGIFVSGTENVVDGNTTTDNDDGIEVTGTGNLIVRNSSSNNATDDYLINAGNNFGVITSLAGAGAFASTDPWTNFEF
jgi:parallel beta-helix repeat protein